MKQHWVAGVVGREVMRAKEVLLADVVEADEEKVASARRITVGE